MGKKCYLYTCAVYVAKINVHVLEKNNQNAVFLLLVNFTLIIYNQNVPMAQEKGYKNICCGEGLVIVHVMYTELLLNLILKSASFRSEISICLTGNS